jgi:hypothetical protein
MTRAGRGILLAISASFMLDLLADDGWPHRVELDTEGT